MLIILLTFPFMFHFRFLSVKDNFVPSDDGDKSKVHVSLILLFVYDLLLLSKCVQNEQHAPWSLDGNWEQYLILNKLNE